MKREMNWANLLDHLMLMVAVAVLVTADCPKQMVLLERVLMDRVL